MSFSSTSSWLLIMYEYWSDGNKEAATPTTKQQHSRLQEGSSTVDFFLLSLSVLRSLLNVEKNQKHKQVATIPNNKLTTHGIDSNTTSL